MSALAALLIHEFGHYAASCAMGEEIARIELTPFGGVMYRSSRAASLKGLRGTIIALAGPFANYIAVLFMSIVPLYRMIHVDTMRTLMMANMVMMCINLFPVFPLDGGQAVFCVGYYLFPVAGLISLLTLLGMLTGLMFIGCAVYAFWKINSLNCSLVIIGAYLIRYALSQRETLRAENAYTIVQEQIADGTEETKRVRLYMMPSEMPLYTALPYMDSRMKTVFVVQDENEIRFVSERDVCIAMLRTPNLLFKQFVYTAAE